MPKFSLAAALATARKYTKEKPPVYLQETDVVSFSFWQQRLSILKSFPTSDRDSSQKLLFGDLGAEDLGARAVAVLLQYSVLLCKDQEYESRKLLIDIVADSQRMIIAHSKVYIFREIVVDYVALTAWREAPGHHLPWLFAKGLCVRRQTDSAKLLRLLIYRALRHAALLLESIRRQRFESLLPKDFLDTTTAVHRSLLWETPEPLDLSHYQFVLSEQERVRLGTGAHAQMVDNCVDTIRRVSQRMDEALADTTSEPFTGMLKLYVSTARVARKAGEVQKRHLYKYAVQCEKLVEKMIVFFHCSDACFTQDAALLKVVTDNVMKNVESMQKPEPNRKRTLLNT